jgi:hypothetical protein
MMVRRSIRLESEAAHKAVRRQCCTLLYLPPCQHSVKVAPTPRDKHCGTWRPQAGSTAVEHKSTVARMHKPQFKAHVGEYL